MNVILTIPYGTGIGHIPSNLLAGRTNHFKNDCCNLILLASDVRFAVHEVLDYDRNGVNNKANILTIYE